MVNKTSTSKLRAVGYCRTSGEGQRDNTSIPRQRKDIENFITVNEWKFLNHYVDESKSGSKIEGRDNFKQMMRDAANGKFDIIVVYDITRFARDGADIIGESRVLKSNFGIHVIDTKGYDTRDHRNILMNFVKAGLTEAEKLTIMERTIGGRIQRAKDGLPWCANPPVGRAFNRTGKHSGEWYITEKGERLKKVLKRYVQGEPITALTKEFGFPGPQIITAAVHHGCLSGTYHATFNSPDIGINNIKIAVPAIPQIISPELEQKVRECLSHNRRWNKQHKKKYLLSGFAQCGDCGRSLTAQTNSGKVYYRHNANYKTTNLKCQYRGIRADLLEPFVLDYLYSFFLDEPSYTEAIKAALPSDDDRKMLLKDIKQATKRLSVVNRETENLINAIAAGADVGLLLSKQNELKAEKQAVETRLDELNQTLVSMPDPQQIENDAMMLRLRLVQEHQDKDWRKLPFDDIRKFLHFLFSDNPKKNGFGISISHIDDKWHITFKGSVEFCHDVIDGRPISHIMTTGAKTINAKLKRDFQNDVAKADKAYQEEMKACIHVVKPSTDNVLS